ncbi:MAG: MATE family efflux transporter [Proteobacteria bacterium]|nr:MATE family efflux transporter [Pseudomonadota bacterium]
MFKTIARDILKLGWPVLIGQLAVMVNGVIDTVMAGRLGAADLAAVGIGASIYISVFVTLMGVLIALTPVVAQLYGARKYAEIGEEVRQSLWLGGFLTAVAFVLIYFPDPFLELARVAPEVEVKTRAYLRTIAIGVPAMLVFRVFYSFSTAVSRPRVIMVLNLVGLALKIPLNLVFMHGHLGMPALGGPGCAVSTTIIAWVTALAGWAYCRASPDCRPYGVFSRWSWPVWREQRRLLQIGLPIGFTFLVDVTSFTFMALFIARLGTVSSGGHQVASNFAALLYMMPLAMSSAAGVLVGQAIGAGDLHRARLTGLLGISGGFGIACVVGLSVWLGRDAIAGLYARDAEVRAIAAALLAYVACYHLFDAASAIAVSVLRGYKKTFVPMLCNIFALWGLGLGGGYALAFGYAGRAPMGAPGFWLAATAALMAGSVVMTLYFLAVSRSALAGRGS